MHLLVKWSKNGKLLSFFFETDINLTNKLFNIFYTHAVNTISNIKQMSNCSVKHKFCLQGAYHPFCE